MIPCTAAGSPRFRSAPADVRGSRRTGASDRDRSRRRGRRAHRSRLARRHQAARAGAGAGPRRAEERGGSPGQAQGRYRSPRTGSQQAQPATDRGRLAGPHHRNQHRRCRRAIARAGRARGPDAGLARFPALRRGRGAGGPAARRPPLSARPADPARGRPAIGADRDAARIAGAGIAGARGEDCRARSAN